MIANFEIIAYKGGARRVWTIAKEVYSGIARDLFERCRAAGFENITIRMF